MTAQSGGRIGSTWRDSEPWWPAEPAPPAGSPNILLIPGTSSVAHLRENVAGAGLTLSADDLAELDRIAS